MRYWAFAKLGRLPREETAPLIDGRAAHKQAELYLRDGTPPDVTTKHGRWLIEGLHLLPAPRTCWVERDVTFEGPGGVRLRCILDAVHLQSATKLDHKFVGDGRFALTEATLIDDVQAVINVLAPPVFPRTNLRWVYYPKRGTAKPWAVDAQLTPEDAEATFREKYLPVVQTMRAVRAEFAGIADEHRVELCQAVPSNPSACFAFGRPCEYIHICKKEPIQWPTIPVLPPINPLPTE
jgi:hypothetical protein